MSDVFVSYKAEDKRRVKPLVEALEADGYSVWWDEQIGGGAAWRQAIETELNAAKCVIVAWSKRSIAPEGAFVQDEATRAQQRHVYVPVLIDKVHVPLGFGETQALPLTGWKGSRSDPRYQAVLAAVRRNAGDAEGRSESRQSGPRVDRRAVLAGGAVATIAVAGAGGWMLLKPDPANADSIAVLPFANLSGDPGQAYFSDGIAEELRSALARIAGLKVVGRISSEAVRDHDATTAAKRLRVSNIIVGSVRRSPSTVRVGVQLINGRDGLERWSKTYDRAPGDVIKIQTDIAENVARALALTLSNAARTGLVVGGTLNPVAHDLALQALQLSFQPTRSAKERAVQLLDEAIELDPEYADAYAKKSRIVLALTAWASGAGEVAAARSRAFSLAKRAVELAPELPGAHLAMADVYRYSLQFTLALREYERAKALAPSDPQVLRNFAPFLANMGLVAEALKMADHTVALDPLTGYSYGNRVLVYFLTRRYSQAVSEERRLTQDWPEQSMPLLASFSLMLLGRYNEARALLEKAPAGHPIRQIAQALLAARTDDRKTALRNVAQLKQQTGDTWSVEFAEIYSQLGDREQAFAHLYHAFSIKDVGLLGLKVDPFLDPLRSDRRFAQLMAKMNFPA